MTLTFATDQNIEDAASNALTNTAPTGANDNTFVVDNTAPTVTSILRQTPTASPTDADELTWRVTFSEEVANVDSADFAIAGTTAALTAAAVPGSSLAYDVTASGGDLGSLDATVTLSFAASHNITDAAGNALADTAPTSTNDNTFVLDNTAPGVASIERQTPTASPTNADELIWRVTFSEAVANVDTADFAIAGTTATLTAAAVPGSPLAYDVTASGGDLRSLNATVTLAFATDQNIEDAAGTALTNTAPTGANDNTFVVDNTAPRVTSILRQTPTASPTDADELTWRVTFSEEVANVDSADFEVSDTTAALTATAVQGSSLAWDVKASGGNLADLNATVTLAFATDQNIEDAASNALTNTTPTGANDNTFVVDNTAPTVTSVMRQTPTTSPTDADELTWRVTFSEEVANVDSADFEVSDTTAALTATAVQGSSLAWDVKASGGNLADLNATVTLAFATDQNIEDAAGNALTNTTPTGANDNTFVVDNTAPTVTSVMRQTPTTSPTDADELTWRVTFSEEVANVDSTDFEVSDTTAALTATAVQGSSLAWDVKASGGNLGSLDATVTLAFATAQNIEDAAGNALTNTTPTGANVNTFVVDNTAPTVTSIVRQTPSASPTNADDLTWRVTFSEDVANVDAADFTVSNTTATPTATAVPGSSLAYDVTASGGDLGSLDATVTLSFVASQNIADPAGNALTNTTPTGANDNTFVVDNISPTVTITDVPDPSSAAFTAKITFSEGVDGFAVEDIAVGNGAASAFTGSDGDTEFTALITPTADGEVTVDVAADVAMDAAGNGNAAAARASSIYDNTAPTVTSIVRQTPSASPTNADDLTWRVTFSEDVANVDAADFTVSNTTATPTATAVPGSSLAYDVTASGGDLGSLDATVTLSFVASQNIADPAGNALTNTTPTGANDNTFVVDNISPTVTITDVPDPSSAAFTAKITFSEGVDGFAVEDIAVGNGAASAFTGSDGDTEFTALITPTADGEVTVDVAADVAMDAAGNGNAAAARASSIYDNTAPTVASITRQTPSVSPTNADDLTWRVTFSEALANVDAADFTIAGTTATLTAAAVPGSSLAYDVTASGGDLGSLDATVTLSFVASQNIADPAGNALADTAPTSTNDNTFVVDNTAPGVASIVRQTPTASPTNADDLAWRVTFSEAVANVDTADFAIAGTTATPTADAVPGSSLAYDVTASGGDLGSLDATVTLSFVASQNIADPAGNALTNTTPTGANDNTFVVDNTSPTVTITDVPDPSSAAFTAKITFSEGVDGFAVEDIAVGNGAASAFTGSDGDTEFTALIAPTADGAVTVDVAEDVAMDAAGNGNAAAARASSTYTAPLIDTIAPTVTSIVRQTPSASPTNADDLTWRVTFSEDVANVDAADFTVSNTTATPTATAVSGSSAHYDVTASGGDLGSLDATVTLSFAASHNIADTAGNALANTTPMGVNDNSFIVDNTAPTVVSATVDGTSLVLTHSEDLDAAAVPGADAFAVLADGSTAALANTGPVSLVGATLTLTLAAAATVSADQTVTVTYTAPTGPGAAPLRDVAGNPVASDTAGRTVTNETAPPDATVCNAPNLTGRQQVWQGTLTVGRHSGGLPRELVGYGWYSRTGSLSGRSTLIELGENSYRIGDLVLLYAHSGGLIPLLVPAPGTLVFHLIGATDRNAELTTTERAGLALHVCDLKFNFSAAARPGGTGPGEVVPSEPQYAEYDRHYLWGDNAELNWSAGLVRTLTLSLPVVSSDVRAAVSVEGLPELTGPGEDGVYAPGDRIEVRVRFDAPVTVDASGGAPTLGLALGGVRREAAYKPGQDGGAATELVFALAVSDEDAGAGAAKAIANGIRLNGATIRDEGSADAVLDYGAAPGAVAVEIGAEPSGDGVWTAGEAVEVTISFAEPVEVGTEEGTPSVGLTLSGAGGAAGAICNRLGDRPAVLRLHADRGGRFGLRGAGRPGRPGPWRRDHREHGWAGRGADAQRRGPHGRSAHAWPRPFGRGRRRRRGRDAGFPGDALATRVGAGDGGVCDRRRSVSERGIGGRGLHRRLGHAHLQAGRAGEDVRGRGAGRRPGRGGGDADARAVGCDGCFHRRRRGDRHDQGERGSGGTDGLVPRRTSRA